MILNGIGYFYCEKMWDLTFLLLVLVCKCWAEDFAVTHSLHCSSALGTCPSCNIFSMLLSLFLLCLLLSSKALLGPLSCLEQIHNFIRMPFSSICSSSPKRKCHVYHTSGMWKNCKQKVCQTIQSYLF